MHSLRPLAFLKETVHPKTIALTSISMLAITAGPMSSHWWNDDWISSKAWWLIKWDVIASAAVCLLFLELPRCTWVSDRPPDMLFSVFSRLYASPEWVDQKHRCHLVPKRAHHDLYKCVIHEPVDPNRICPAHCVMGTIWRWLVVCNGNHWQIFNEISKDSVGERVK